MPVRHFYLLPHYICDGLFFYFLCFGFTRNVFNNLWEKEGRGRRSWLILSFWYQNTEKRNNALSQMRLRSVFKMRMSILNTATTEQMGYGIISFFVYTKSTNSYFLLFLLPLRACLYIKLLLVLL